jgi:Patatin-like phospholipase
MKPFRQHVALAVDGGGIRGTMVAKALAIVEAELGQQCADLFQMTAGTSTGSIISAALASRIPAAQIHELYVRLGATIFKKTWRAYWPLAGYKYPNTALKAALRETLGERKMGEFWSGPNPLDVIVTVRDLVENRTLFVKSWKDEYKGWEVWKAVLCSSTVPTYFPVVDGRYVDGGVGSYTNPCYIAAYEAVYLLGWDPAETTLISIGTGREPSGIPLGKAGHFNALEWILPLVNTFLADANDQQVRVVLEFFPALDFRRFQIDLDPVIPIDDPSGIPALTKLGEKLAQMILSDQTDKKVLRLRGQVK